MGGLWINNANPDVSDVARKFALRSEPIDSAKKQPYPR